MFTSFYKGVRALRLCASAEALSVSFFLAARQHPRGHAACALLTNHADSHVVCVVLSQANAAEESGDDSDANVDADADEET